MEEKKDIFYLLENLNKTSTHEVPLCSKIIDDRSVEGHPMKLAIREAFRQK